MIWKRHAGINGQYFMTSDTGHTLNKFCIGGEWFYELWWFDEMIATRLPSAAVAQALAQRQEAGETDDERSRETDEVSG